MLNVEVVWPYLERDREKGWLRLERERERERERGLMGFRF